jgi:hypothetical protein
LRQKKFLNNGIIEEDGKANRARKSRRCSSDALASRLTNERDEFEEGMEIKAKVICDLLIYEA